MYLPLQTLTFNYRQRATSGAQWIDSTASIDTQYGEMVSIFHHMPLNTDIDAGGPWNLDRTRDMPHMGQCTYSRYDGPFTCQVRTTQFPDFQGYSDWTDSQMYTFGTHGISASAPTNPSFSLSTALGELRQDGLPAVTGAEFMKERTHIARSAGSEYLNAEFGWLPLISDARGFASAVKGSATTLDRYRKGSGKKSRVSYFGPLDSDNIVHSGAILPFPVSVNISGKGTTSGFRQRRQWFKGAFKYHIPTNDTQLGKFQQWHSHADHILGLDVTPETLWNIAPWSWASDWYSNTGDVLANVSNLGKDSLVMQYGYSMAETTLRYDSTGFFSWNGGSATVGRSYERVTKRRMPANPYGFGVTSDSLSTTQKAILVALGLSKT